MTRFCQTTGGPLILVRTSKNLINHSNSDVTGIHKQAANVVGVRRKGRPIAFYEHISKALFNVRVAIIADQTRDAPFLVD